MDLLQFQQEAKRTLNDLGSTIKNSVVLLFILISRIFVK